MIGIIDYGMGNLKSVQKAFEFLGFKTQITNDFRDFKKFDKIVLPGVGAFADAIKTIRNMEFDKSMKEEIEKGKPFLGICLGMQLIFDKSYENGEYEGLGFISGVIKRLPNNVKIPHIGWNNLEILKREPLFESIGNSPYVYFVHSYYLETDESVVSAVTEYGKKIQVGVQKDNIFALQFHPEKSGDIGLKILENFGGIEI